MDEHTTTRGNDISFDDRQPSIVLAVLMILGITLAFAALVVAIESLAGFKIPGGTLSSAVLPVGVAGYLYGRRKGIRLSRAFRFKVIAFWYLLSIAGSVLVVYLMDVKITDLARELGGVGVSAFVALMLLSGLISYLAFGYGNKLALKEVADPHSDAA